MSVSSQTIQRDKDNARAAKEYAHNQLKELRSSAFVDDITGSYSLTNRALTSHYSSERKSLIAICEQPFHAMAEVETVHENGRASSALWYANENIAITQVLNGVIIVPWTHPGFQLAITEDIEQPCDINDKRYNLSEITPLARARFQKVFPDIVGIYDPGGQVGQLEKVTATTGLKTVKLHMTKDQVNAFISKMKGVLFISGAPGSGKTTVAFQRMRFLFDEGEKRTGVVHSPANSKVFLANENLISHSKNLLEKHLDIPSSIVSLIKTFIEVYLDDVWRFKHDALFLSHDISDSLQRRAREAFFSTCSVDDMKACWKTYELQIIERISDVSDAEWTELQYRNVEKKNSLKVLLSSLGDFSKRQQKKQLSASPLLSEVNMDRLYQHCKRQYDNFRSELSRPEIEQFDGMFSKWLYYVYDPLDCLIHYFGNKTHAGELRIRRGTGSRVNEKLIIQQILEDWSKRRYRREEIGWLAWLLRFVLPKSEDSKDRFREMRNASSPVSGKYGPWYHIVIDEAQDLSVVEASLLSSFVVRDGALTIAADFRQVVSPVHGMTNPDAFRLGCNLLGQSDDFTQFPFTKNMRQTGQIGKFLKSFYQKAFGELPQFMANEEMIGPKPQLHIMPYLHFAQTIRKMLNVFKVKKLSGSMAFLQINEDEDEMMRYRQMLEKENIRLAPIWASDNSDGALVTTSIERIKGLEYDICFVTGLEKADNTTLNFNMNRVYVALSRPAERLYMFCEHIPSLLHGIHNDLYDVFDDR
jgi:hypothetical protein